MYANCCRCAGGSFQYPGLGLLIMGYTVFACLYVIGLFSALPRTMGHDAVLALGFCSIFPIWRLWAYVEHIPRVGGLIYHLPAATLAAAPFAIDVYLMYGR